MPEPGIVDIDKLDTKREGVCAIYGATQEIFEEEAEQSRLMTAISAGKCPAIFFLLIQPRTWFFNFCLLDKAKPSLIYLLQFT